MIESLSAYRCSLAVLGFVVLASACGDTTGPGPGPGPQPVTVASVELTSPIGALLDVGGSAQLVATAKSDGGATVSGVSFTWTSSDPDVVLIDNSGFIQALKVGTATVRVATSGVAATLAVRVVDADLSGITARATDPFVVALVGAASAGMKARLQAAVTDCTAGAAQGRLEGIQDCVTDIENEAANAGDPTDRALLAVLSLFADDIKRLLNL